ncbi:MAG: hypothetical protein GWO11_03545 [Desulfuromonadales bacterium]|nr:hypothetical protein [Desulfuromonadales bacterium]NIR33522.1 hypothetical protein [Desulfuromonadales bacterium]NIS39696.1 hypothetical protein [Desulfuromonadales bacterium]
MSRLGGGILIVLLLFGGWGLLRAVAAPTGDCDVCGRTVHAGTRAVVSMPSGETMELCCSRCALAYQRRNDLTAASLLFSDASGRGTLSAEDAFFVEGGKAADCCAPAAVLRDGAGLVAVSSWDRCRPSLRAFAERTRAEAFARRHGGRVADWRQL